MGVSTHSLHAKGAKHQESFRNYNQRSIPCTFNDTRKADDGRINTMMNPVAVFHAGIHGIMKIVTSHFFLLFSSQYE